MKIEKLPRAAKIAATQSLRSLDFSIRHIAQILGINKNSVMVYLKEAPAEEWDEFKTAIKKIVGAKEEEIAAKCLREIEDKMPKARFFELVGLYKTIRDLQKPVTGVQVNVLNQLNDVQKKYDI